MSPGGVSGVVVTVACSRALSLCCFVTPSCSGFAQNHPRFVQISLSVVGAGCLPCYHVCLVCVCSRVATFAPCVHHKTKASRPHVPPCNCSCERMTLCVRVVPSCVLSVCVCSAVLLLSWLWRLCLASLTQAAVCWHTICPLVIMSCSPILCPSPILPPAWLCGCVCNVGALSTTFPLTH